MSKKIFNPNDWQPVETMCASSNNSTPPANLPLLGRGIEGEVEAITQRIETASTDIAPNYADWRDLGFALADALGESGRSYFHRLSRFYSGYTENETDKQFDNCLKSNGHGVTIKTLFHLAKTSGINVSVKSPSFGGVGEASISLSSPEIGLQKSKQNLGL